MIIPLESNEQAAFISWARYHPICRDLLFAIPNGGRRDAREAKSLVAQGVLKGVPDLMLPVARGTYHGLFIEMKRKKGAVTSPDQIKFISKLTDEGYCVFVSFGWEDAVRYTENYLAM